MASRSSSQLVLLLFLVAMAILGHGFSALLGGWQPIKNLKDPQVQSIAKFAVAEHNKAPGVKPLVLLKVISGETQVVAGTNYRLVIKATDGAAAHSYQAVVWDKPWENFRNLTSFKLIKP